MRSVRLRSLTQTGGEGWGTHQSCVSSDAPPRPKLQPLQPEQASRAESWLSECSRLEEAREGQRVQEEVHRVRSPLPLTTGILPAAN